jgi:hypothetical protein
MEDVTYIIHVYYPGSWKMITDKCAHLFAKAASIIVSACDDDVIEEIKNSEYDIVIQKVTNKGKDIGGKLAGLAYYYSFCKPSAYLAFLHDKISPQTLNAGYWFDKLYDIFSPGKLSRVENLLANPSIGLIGSKDFLKNEYSRKNKNFKTTNDSILKELLDYYKLRPATFDYIGGTIFITRHDSFADFFTKHDALIAREKLEEGNVLDLEEGTYTHSWERMLGFIPQAAGFKLAGI